jgi:hypothetical protein
MDEQTTTIRWGLSPVLGFSLDLLTATFGFGTMHEMPIDLESANVARTTKWRWALDRRGSQRRRYTAPTNVASANLRAPLHFKSGFIKLGHRQL